MFRVSMMLISLWRQCLDYIIRDYQCSSVVRTSSDKAELELLSAQYDLVVVRWESNNCRWWPGLISVNHINTTEPRQLPSHLYTSTTTLTDWLDNLNMVLAIILHGFQYFKLDGLFTIFCQLQQGRWVLGGANLVNFNNCETFISAEKSQVFFLIIIISW